LHPPYTAWNLSYVAIGSAVAPSFHAGRLVSEEGAFFLGLGIAAHALDELKGRPLRTSISDATLVVAAVVALIGAAVLGATGLRDVGPWLIAFIGAGVALVLAYNLEWFSGAIHTDAGFAAAWGAFPVLAGYFVQAKSIGVVALLVATAGYLLSAAQRALSSPARKLRRRVRVVEGSITLEDGSSEPLDAQALLAPYDLALRAMSFAMVALAAGLVLYRVWD
jgi:hypothetical protein